MVRRGVGVSAGVLLALIVSTAAVTAQSEDVAPAEADDSARYFVDTRVEDVVVDDQFTVAVMTQSAQSRCPSAEYIFERVRPKWLNTTGRLMQALKEGAELRVSFSCIRGYQSINAIQFLSPPPGRMASDMPRRSQAVAVTPNARATLDARRAPPAAASSAAPAPAGVATQTQRSERLRGVPLPAEAASTGAAPLPTPGSGPPGPVAQGVDGQPYVNERVRAIPLP